MPTTARTPALRTASRKFARLEARVKQETKELCEHAAALKGLTLTDFVVNSAVEAAHRTIRESTNLDLSRRDRIAFIEAVLNPPAPNRLLKAAAARHKKALDK